MSEVRSFIHNWCLAMNEVIELEEIASELVGPEDKSPDMSKYSTRLDYSSRLTASAMQIRVAMSRLIDHWKGDD